MPADGLAAFILRAARAVSLSLPFALSLFLSLSLSLGLGPLTFLHSRRRK